MKERIESRIKELYIIYNNLSNPDYLWFKQTNGLSRKETINKCIILIEELETLLKS